MKELENLIPPSVDALVCIRRELGIETDIEQYKQLTNERMVLVQNAFNNFMNSLPDQ